jgi:hypothetical protein
VAIRYQKTYPLVMDLKDIVARLWIFFGFRIWGIGFVLGISYFGLTGLFPFLPEKEVGYLVIACGVAWVTNSLFKLFRADDPSIDEN